MALLIKNIGQIATGDIQNPLVYEEAVLIQDGRIAALGGESALMAADVNQVIDANGCTLTPGLIDSHV
ncbi:MAG: hypothetical protein KDE59_30175, partial [Anaerolineales bacterium]|nr:hypothetical protein [Anaerolineales bacterium]